MSDLISAECDPEVKCISCGHHIAERPLEVYCNIMCKWVNEKDYCTMFEPGHEKGDRCRNSTLTKTIC